MKTFQSLSVLLMTALVLSSCSAKQPLAGGQKTQNPFGETFEAPCQVYDTKQDFAASTSFRGSSMQRNEVQKNALLAAQDLIRLKMQHAYVGMVSEYSASVGNNRGNDIERKMSSAGDRIIDAIINETLQSCVRWSGIYDNGDIECYIAIEISKEETARRISKEVKDHLTQDEKDRIGFNEEQYREKMQKRFEEYKENH
jgi:hypothetical protein